MPVNITEKISTTVIKVNSAKILNINIDVENKKVVFIIGFGTVTGNDFKKIRNKSVIYSGAKFIEIANSGVIGANNIYENISDTAYAFLERDGHLNFTF